jgi:hypothetical protein
LDFAQVAMCIEMRAVLKALLIVQTIVLALAPCAWSKDFFGIIDYHPTTFVEKPAAPFFFSIGAKLRFGTVIVDDGPVLFAAKPSDKGISAVYVSPNERKAAVVSGANLYLVQPGQAPVRLLGDVYNLTSGRPEMRGPPGKPVYDYWTIHWDATSRFLYVARGTWMNGYPSHMTLMRIDVSDPSNIVEVTNDGKGWGIFFVGHDVVCFQRVVNRGDLVWKCVDNGIEKTPVAIEGNRIVMHDGSHIEGKPFTSYHWSRGEIWLTNAGFVIRACNSRWGFFSWERPSTPIFQFNGAVEPLKGHYVDGIDERSSNVLPGNRYAFLKLHMENFKGRRGQILVDGLTGQYRELPQDTLVYRNLNSLNYEYVKFGLRWFDRPEFVPVHSLRPYTP